MWGRNVNVIFDNENLSDIRIGYMVRGISRLSPRERQVFGAIVQARTAKQLAKELDISHRTIEVHRTRMLEKLGARSVMDLFAMLLKASATDKLDLTSVRLSSMPTKRTG